MPEAEMLNEQKFRAQQRRQLGDELHELCQPLTTLQCCLEMALLSDSREAYREAVEVGLAECRRIVESVESMRRILRAV